MYQKKFNIANIVYYKKYLFIYIFLFSLKLLSQPVNFCGMECDIEHDHSLPNLNKSISDISFAHYNGKYLPVRGNLKALAIFIQFNEDDTDDPDWQLNEIPSYAEELSKMLHEYYHVISNGEFNLEVDIYPKIVTAYYTAEQYASWGLNYGHVNREILERVDEEISFLPYDNWVHTVNYQGYAGQNNKVDLVFMIYRRLTDKRILGYWGISDLGYTGKFLVDNTKRYIYGGDTRTHQDASSSGLTICKGPGTGMVMDLMSAYRLLIHESLHKYIGEGHIIDNFATLGVLSGSSGSFGMHSFEKAFLGFLNYKVVDMPTDTIITIRDYVSTRESYLIPVPGLLGDYYILENHQQISQFDEAQEKGLYIFYLRYSNDYGQLDIQTADGKWDWVLDKNNNVVKYSPNPISGRSRLEVITINNKKYYPPEMEGNSNDPFKMDGQRIYAPWTNPTSNGKGIKQDVNTNVIIQLIDEKNGDLIVRLTDNASIVQVENLSSVNEFKLNQNYPNPFNNSTKISFSLNKSSNVLIKVFDILGCEVKTLMNEFKSTGTYVLDFDGNNMNSGVYFLRMQTEHFTDTKKIILLK